MLVWVKTIDVTIIHGIHNTETGRWQFVHFVHAMTLEEIYKLVPFEILHSLTPRNRVLLEKLIGFQLAKKFPAFYGTRRFITAVTSACHLFLS